METDDIVVMQTDCERCDGHGCEYCFGQPEAVRTRNGLRLCEHVDILRDFGGGWLDVECVDPAVDRLEFTCQYEGMPGPQKCVIHVCRIHRRAAVEEIGAEDTTLDAEVHRLDGFPVIGTVVPPDGPEMMGCPICAVEDGMDSVAAWESAFNPGRRVLPQREIVREFTAFASSDPTTAYELSCGHTVL